MMENTRDRMSMGSMFEEIAQFIIAGDMQSGSILGKELPRPPVTTIKFPVMRKNISKLDHKITKCTSLTSSRKFEIYKRDELICRYSPESNKLLHPGA